MKLFPAILLLFPLLSFSYEERYDCQYQDEFHAVDLVLERLYGFRTWRGWLTKTTPVKTDSWVFNSIIPRRGTRLFETRYFGGNFDLRVDTFPDRVPLTLRTYRARFVNSKIFQDNLNCQYFSF